MVISTSRPTRAVGAKGFSAGGVADLKPAVQAWLSTPGVALLDVQVDAEEGSHKLEKVAA
ncbi:hypothetical protein [Methylorubrum extorquens]|uniref:hypothetical protein n=1 Tax=Methylorubrum extorquens TaxID=408 RepID=UPI000304E619|nr:hypothetical protein [Methylorubrum extorquens]